MCEVGRRRYFGVERFDRLAQQGDRRRHAHTLPGLLNVGIGDAVLDYRDLIKVTSRLVVDHRAMVEVLRRAIFNVLAHNRDDHAKNHSFLMGADGRWTLSPAYDIGFSSGPSGQHQLTVAGEGRAPEYTHVRELAQLGGVMESELRMLIEAVSDAIATWDVTAKRWGIAPQRRRTISAQLARVRAAFGMPSARRSNASGRPSASG